VFINHSNFSTMKFFIFLITIGIVSALSGCKQQKQRINFEPSFESLEQVNPVPEWFKDAKFGIYFHWGIYSVPAFHNEWYPRNMYFDDSVENRHHVDKYGPVDQFPYHGFIKGMNDKDGNFYQFAPRLTSNGGNFDPVEWAQLFADAGARFAGPVAEHHDGFSMWASKANPWNAKDMGPNLDLVKLLTDEIRKQDMKVILSMHHAYQITGFFERAPKSDDPMLQILYGQLGKEKNEALWMEKHKEIIDQYQPDIIWQDFNLTAISEPVLLNFLAYYYNHAQQQNKEVVATYKDALNPRLAVLDYERGGPTDLTEYYWLTDDAISSTSWCYTEGIGYYSKKQVLHGFFDRISKNGNLLLNISPMADGTIPQEQKDILLSMGDWLKKYGEAIYSTRAWEKYGEGPTKMGAAHGVFTAPNEGTNLDIRYTRSKDNTTLYAILLGWDDGQEAITLTSLTSDRIDLSNLKDVSLITQQPGHYKSLQFLQDEKGLTVKLPKKEFDEPAYVLKLSFRGKINHLNKFADIDSFPHYYLSPNGKPSPVLGASGNLSNQRQSTQQQWKLEPTGSKGVYKIINRENPQMVLTANGNEVSVTQFNDSDGQYWKIDLSYEEMLLISTRQNPSQYLSINNDKASLTGDKGLASNWKLLEICETIQSPYKPHSIPGTIEVEDFDHGCAGDAWFDRDDNNAGGQYRTDTGVDIEVSSAGGYNVGWTNTGEWLAYSVEVLREGDYELTFYVASNSGSGKIRLESEDKNLTGTISLPNTGGYQQWKPVKTSLRLKAGKQVLKIYVEYSNSDFNLDKMTFRKIN
jgi:alpha-L-fucosidase